MGFNQNIYSRFHIKYHGCKTEIFVEIRFQKQAYILNNIFRMIGENTPHDDVIKWKKKSRKNTDIQRIPLFHDLTLNNG